jgi:two-component system sensor histidine kinase DegS
VAQEALTNVVKHAQATQVDVRLLFLPSTVKLQVEDNGCGFDLSARTQRPAWGLLGMEERAKLLEGQVTIRSAPGQGTCVEMTIPYQSNVEVDDGNTPAAGG